MGAHFMIAAGVRYPAVFLDRDGVINDVHRIDGNPRPPLSLGEFRLLPGVRQACDLLKSCGFQLVVATNQPDVGRGLVSRSVVEQIHEELRRQLPVDHVEVCYAAGTEKPPSEYRKPRPGMLLRAAAQLSIDLSSSWMVGDRWKDIRCGEAAGCRTVFVNRNYTEEMNAVPDYWAADLLEAAFIIRNTLQHSRPQVSETGHPPDCGP
jgi:D-glycero-D-manno-heptose 1,7-bisphosphate phosphatase